MQKKREIIDRWVKQTWKGESVIPFKYEKVYRNGSRIKANYTSFKDAIHWEKDRWFSSIDTIDDKEILLTMTFDVSIWINDTSL